MKPWSSALLVLLFPLLLAAGTTSVYNVKDYGATGNGTTDDGAAITAAANALESAGGGTLYFPPGTYKIYSSGTTYRYLTAFGGPDASHPFNGINLVADHATLAIDPTNTAITAEGWGAIFAIANSVNVKIDGFNVTGPTMDITSATVKGVVFAQFYDGVVNVSMPNNTVQGVLAGVNVSGTPNNTTNPSRDFDIGILDVK